MVGIALSLLLAIPAFGQQGSVTSQQFLGLDDTNPAATLAPGKAQDMLNVESSLGGVSWKKRGGYSREASLTVATSPVTGRHKFFDDSGNETVIVCHDHECAASVNGGAFTAFLSTAGGGSIPSRWSFVDVDGDVYGANDLRDTIWRFNGTADEGLPDLPQGSLLALTDDRLVISDTSANPNRVHYSASGDFTDFTTANDKADPYTDDIGAPGDRVTALFYTSSKLYVFKRKSITACQLDGQYNSQCFTIADHIGTTDPESIVQAPGGIYFQASDGTYWRMTDKTLDPISQEIGKFIRNRAIGSNRSNTQTTQIDWEAGNLYYSGGGAAMSATINPGSVTPSTWTGVDTSSANFSGGSTVNGSTLAVDGSLYFLQGSSPTMTNLGAESNSTSINYATNEFTVSGTAYYGSYSWSSDCALEQGSNHGVVVSILDENGGTLATTNSFTVTNDNSWTTRSASLAGITNSMIAVKIVVTPQGSAGCTTNTLQTEPFINGISGSSITFVTQGLEVVDDMEVLVDFPEGHLFPVNHTSRIFDRSISTPIAGPFTVSMTSSNVNTLTFTVQASTADDGGGFETAIAQTPNEIIGAEQYRYVRYNVLGAITCTTCTAASIQDVTLEAATTGQYLTQCIQPGSGISSWGIMSCATSVTGNSSITFSVSTAPTCAQLTASTITFTSQTNNATIGVDVAAAINILGTFSIPGSSTDTASIDACTIYWNEGSPVDTAYGEYDSIQNAIYWTAQTSAATSSDRLIKYDLNLLQWYPFALNPSSLLFHNNKIYFGDSTAGYWNKFAPDGVSSDNGSNINAYVKTRDFVGASPFQETDWISASSVLLNQGAGSVTIANTYGNGISDSHSVSTSTDSTKSYIRDNYYIQKRSPHNFMNLKFSNNSSVPFEVLGYRLDFNTRDWRPVNP